MENQSKITILTALGDNYIYLAEYAAGRCWAVDPGDAEVVLKELAERHLQLTHILITHHHADHIGGVARLKHHTGCTVIGPDRTRIRDIDMLMDGGDMYELENIMIHCISTPGHTATSVCYEVTGGPFNRPVLFTGDTLFVCGCGRMFECKGKTMFESLQKLNALPDEILVYPGHDYTEENVRFALTVHPENNALQEKLKKVSEQANHSRPTVPSILGEEKELNPFLTASGWRQFESLRREKDVF